MSVIQSRTQEVAMSELTVLYVKAGFVLAVSLLAFILVTRAAMPANRMVARSIAAWLRTLPERWRRLRDSAYRARAERIDRYEMVMGGLIVARAERDRTARSLAEVAGSGTFGERMFETMRDEASMRYEGITLVAAAYLKDLREPELTDVATHVATSIFSGRVPVDEVRAFLEEERAIAERTPQLMADHAVRLIRRFAHLVPDASASPTH
jgi:hypothetical protein